MSTLESRIIDLAVAVGADIKALNTAIAQIQAPSQDVEIDGGSAYTVYTSGPNGNNVIDGGSANG